MCLPILLPGMDPEEFKRAGGTVINTNDPIARKKEYEDSLLKKSLSNPQWGSSDINMGEEVTLSVSCTNIKDFQVVYFKIFKEGADPKVDAYIAEEPGSVSEGYAEAKWFPVDPRSKKSREELKLFFVAWSFKAEKVKSSSMQVYNPRILDVVWNRKAYFLGEEAELTVKSFEMSNTSPTVTVELWEEDISNPDNFVLSQDVTVDDEVSVNIPFEFSQSELEILSNFNMDEKRDLEIYPILKQENEKMHTPPRKIKIKTGA